MRGGVFLVGSGTAAAAKPKGLSPRASAPLEAYVRCLSSNPNAVQNNTPKTTAVIASTMVSRSLTEMSSPLS